MNGDLTLDPGKEQTLQSRFHHRLGLSRSQEHQSSNGAPLQEMVALRDPAEGDNRRRNMAMEARP
jgi:hypothetical protein